MRTARLLLFVCLVAGIAGFAASDAGALGFTDIPCPPDAGAMKICPDGTVGTPYSVQLAGRTGSGCWPYDTFAVISGSTPPGISVSSSGLISGTPTTAGTYQFYVQIKDYAGPDDQWCTTLEHSERQFQITITGGAPPPAPVKIAQSTLAPAATVLNTPYTFQFSAQGGGTQTWTLQSGTLPSGVTLSSGGLLSGTPTVTGDFTFTVGVINGTSSDTHTYTLSVVAPLKITVPTATVAEIGRALKLQLEASGGKAAYTWSLASGSTLPNGLALDAQSGAVTGTPSQSGTFALKFVVTDAFGLTDTTTVNLDVARKLMVASVSRVARLRHALTARLRPAGGVLPVAWRVVHGSLPAGIRFNRATGVFAGKAQRAGTFRLVVQAKDSLGAVARASVVLRIVR
jgi:hypothetical protein